MQPTEAVGPLGGIPGVVNPVGGYAPGYGTQEAMQAAYNRELAARAAMGVAPTIGQFFHPRPEASPGGQIPIMDYVPGKGPVQVGVHQRPPLPPPQTVQREIGNGGMLQDAMPPIVPPGYVPVVRGPAQPGAVTMDQALADPSSTVAASPFRGGAPGPAVQVQAPGFTPPTFTAPLSRPAAVQPQFDPAQMQQFEQDRRQQQAPAQPANQGSLFDSFYGPGTPAQPAQPPAQVPLPVTVRFATRRGGQPEELEEQFQDVLVINQEGGGQIALFASPPGDMRMPVAFGEDCLFTVAGSPLIFRGALLELQLAYRDAELRIMVISDSKPI